MNRFYWQSLVENTTSDFELIIVDNHSTDGSETFFQKLSEKKPERGQVVYLRNEYNTTYPEAQNQGIAVARHDTLCFLNNDLWLPYGWNKPLERMLASNPLLVLSPTSQEAQPTQRASDRLKRKWKYCFSICQFWARLFGQNEGQIFWNALSLMYGDLDSFVSPTDIRPGKDYFNGIAGSAVIFSKALLKRVPEIWDERFQAADWHLYLTLSKLNEQDPSVPLPRVVLDSYVHHFGRYSLHRGYEPLRKKVPLLKIEDFWSAADVSKYWWGNKLSAT